MNFSSESTVWCEKYFYMLFKLLSKEGFNRKEMIDKYGISKNVPTLYLNSIKNILYDFFGDDAKIIYTYKSQTFHLIFFRGSPNIINFYNYFTK